MKKGKKNDNETEPEPGHLNKRALVEKPEEEVQKPPKKAKWDNGNKSKMNGDTWVQYLNAIAGLLVLSCLDNQLTTFSILSPG